MYPTQAGLKTTGTTLNGRKAEVREMGSLCECRYYYKSHQCLDLPPISLKHHLKKCTPIRKDNLDIDSKSEEKKIQRIGVLSS